MRALYFGFSRGLVFAGDSRGEVPTAGLTCGVRGMMATRHCRVNN